MDLDSVISQMNEFVCYVIQSELHTTSTGICIFEKVTFQATINWCKHAVAPKIKLSFVDEQRVVNVFLNDVSAFTFCGTAYHPFYFWKSFADFNTITSVSILSWLNYPSILWDSL